MCPPMWAHWRHLANRIELVLPSVHPSPQPKRQIDRFSRFGRPLVKRFALHVCYRTVVLSVLSCPVCLSVTLVYCGQTVGWIKMKLGMQVGLGPGHTVLDGDPALPKGAHPQFSAHVYSGQTAGWIKMTLGTLVGDILLRGDPALPKRGTAVFSININDILIGYKCQTYWRL